MPTEVTDRLIFAGRVLCPDTGLDGPGAVGVTGGRIAFAGTGLQASRLPPARETLVFGDAVLLPGLVDLHAHPALSGSRFGIDPDQWLLPQGCTTVLSQGDAGARNLDAYLEHTIAKSRTRILVAVNFCAGGESNPAGRFFSLEEASVEECIAAVRRGGSSVWGISLNIAFIRGRDVDPLEVMRRGRRAAEDAGCPVMFGATKSDAVPIAEQLKLLRPGDVMTYCFHSGEGSIVRGGRVLDCVWEARERGVLFDVGDGTGAFGFDVAEAAIAEGFLPDTISSDFYRYHVESGEPHSLLRTVAKLVVVGMPEEECWPRITAQPARVMDLQDGTGSLRVGAPADLVILERGEAELLRDCRGEARTCRPWQPAAIFKSGEQGPR